MLEVSSSGDQPHTAGQPQSPASHVAIWPSVTALAVLGALWLVYFVYVCIPITSASSFSHYMLRLAVQAPLLAIHTGVHALTSADQRRILSRGFVSLYSAVGRLKHISHYFAIGGVLFSICVGAGAVAVGYRCRDGTCGIQTGKADDVLLACVAGAQAAGIIACAALTLQRVQRHNIGLRAGGMGGDAVTFLGIQTSGRSVCEAQAQMIELLREKRDRMYQELAADAPVEHHAPLHGQGVEGKVQALKAAQGDLAHEVQVLERQEVALAGRVQGLREALQGLRGSL